jgi:very-short-patch-repair endonuclease
VLAGYGFEVIRFWDDDVLRNTSAVLGEIARRAAARHVALADRVTETLTPALSRKRERE